MRNSQFPISNSQMLLKHFFYLLTCLSLFQSTYASEPCWKTPRTSQIPTTFILAMGANIGELKKANSDAQTLANALQKRFNVPPSNKCVLTDVKFYEFKRALKRLQKLVREQDEVFIYFSGHGDQLPDTNNDEGCYDEAFVIFPSYGSDLYKLRDDFFVAQVNKIGSSRITTIIDSCFSGGMLRGTKNCLDMKSKSLTSATDILPKKDCPSGIKRLKGTVYTASKEYQLAWESAKGGIFTTLLIDNMQKDPKAKFNLNQIFDMTAKQVSKQTGQRDCDKLQEPQRQP